jgi:superfamily II DNA/RNA helicase
MVPVLERLLFRPRDVPASRVLVLTPTRELAIQCHVVASKLARYTDIQLALVVGTSLALTHTHAHTHTTAQGPRLLGYGGWLQS